MPPRPDIDSVSGTSQKRILIHSHPGRGKTTLIGTSSDPARTLLARPPQDSTDPIAGSGIQEVIISNWSEFSDLVAWMRQDGRKEFDWFWLDSVSIFQNVGLDDIWAGVIAAKPHRATYGLDKGEYGVNMERLGQHVRDLISIKELNIGITAHSAQMTDAHGNYLYMPYVQGRNLSDQFCGYMKMVGYLDLMPPKQGQADDERQRVIRWRATEDWYAKDQHKAFPTGRLLDPTMPKILSAIDSARADDRRAKPSARTKARPALRRPVAKR